MKLRDQCIGKWSGILTQMGVESSFLQNKHGPCPFCGGKDRYRFDDKDGRGTFFCSNCGSGDGFDFCMKLTGGTFKDVAKLIEPIVGGVIPKKQVKKDYTRQSVINAFAGLKHLAMGDNVYRYLKNRGVTSIVGYGLRCHPKLKYYLDGNLSYPAMVALIEGPNKERLGYHATYLSEGSKAPVDAPKKVFKVVEKITGGAIRLSPLQPHIAITEGIENALAVMQKEGLACWAAANAVMMEAIILPPEVKKVTIFGDNDRSFTGQASAYILAKRLVREGREAEVVFRSSQGEDYLDYLNKASA